MSGFIVPKGFQHNVHVVHWDKREEVNWEGVQEAISDVIAGGQHPYIHDKDKIPNDDWDMRGVIITNRPFTGKEVKEAWERALDDQLPGHIADLDRWAHEQKD